MIWVMNRHTPPAAAGLPAHESNHTRTVVNVDHKGARKLEVTHSALSMRWVAGELRINHRMTTVPMRGAAGRGARDRN